MNLYPGEQLEDLQGDLKIIAKKGVYRFSADSVLLAEFVQVSPGERIIDLGTGTGILPLLLTAKTKDLQVVGIEIQDDLADMARRSVKYNKKNREITIITGDLKNAPNVLGVGCWDKVLANPPYFKSSEGRVNPCRQIAIARHEIECTLEDVVAAAQKLLRDSGDFYLVHRSARVSELMEVCARYGLFPVKLQEVASKPGKEPYLILIQFLKGKVQEPAHLPVKYLIKNGGTGCSSPLPEI